MSEMRFGLATGSPAILSRREQEVLRLVASDQTDRQIGLQLAIRERTVRAHVSRIILKLGVTSRVGAAVAFVVWAIRGEAGQCGGSDTAEKPMESTRAELPG